MGSTVYENFVALMHHTKFDSNRTGTLGDDFVSFSKMMGPLELRLPGAIALSSTNQHLLMSQKFPY